MLPVSNRTEKYACRKLGFDVLDTKASLPAPVLQSLCQAKAKHVAHLVHSVKGSRLASRMALWMYGTVRPNQGTGLGTCSNLVQGTCSKPKQFKHVQTDRVNPSPLSNVKLPEATPNIVRKLLWLIL